MQQLLNGRVPSRRVSLEGQRRRCRVGACDGSGWVIDEAGHARGCLCRERERSKPSAATRAELGGRFWEPSLGRPPLGLLPAHVREQLSEYCSQLPRIIDGGGNLWIRGGAGAGKTSACRLLLAAALRLRASVELTSSSGLERRLRGSRSARADIVRALERVELVIIDDADALLLSTSAYVSRAVDLLVDERWLGERPIIIASASMPDEIPALADPEHEHRCRRVLSRITSACQLIDLES